MQGRLLLGVELNDELLVEVKVNVISCRDSDHLSACCLCVEIEPLGSCGVSHVLHKALDLLRRTALILESYNIANLENDGGDVCLLTVEGKVCVTNELTSFLTAACKTHSVYYVVKTTLEKGEKVFTCDAFLLICCYVVLLELLFLYTVVTACCLLLSEVLTVLLNGLTTCAVLTGNSCASVKSALIGKATVALKEKLLSFSSAKLAGRSSISSHTFISSLLIIHGGAWEGGNRYEG